MVIHIVVPMFWLLKLLEAYENARDRVVEFINAREREEVVFTRNTTESMNLIAHSYGLNNLKAGDKIIITCS